MQMGKPHLLTNLLYIEAKTLIFVRKLKPKNLMWLRPCGVSVFMVRGEILQQASYLILKSSTQVRVSKSF